MNNVKVQKKPINKAALKKIVIVVGIIAILAIAFFVGSKIAEKSRQSQRAAALETAIAPIMDDYGLSVYTVKYVDNSYEVFAEGFEDLTKGEALACLEELDDVSTDDPFEDEDLDFGWAGMTKVHPGLNVEYSYWRVSTRIINYNNIVGGGYANKKAGIYYNRYGGSTCVYACDN